MSSSMQWLSLLGGILVLGYGVYRLFVQPDWIPIVLGLLIVAFSVSKIMKSSKSKEDSDRGEPKK